MDSSVPEGRSIHGTISDNPLLVALLNLGNRLRYGRSEAERQAEVQGLRTPGVRDVAYAQMPSVTRTDEGFIPTTGEQFDPAAAERYTSAYELGNRFSVPEAMQPLLHSISRGGREAMYDSPRMREMFGVGPERSELIRAEELGMKRGAKASGSPVEGPLIQALASMMFGQ